MGSLLVCGLFPPRPSLADVLYRLTRPNPAVPRASAAGRWTAKVGRPFVPVMAGLGLPAASLRADLALLDRPPERHLAEKATAALGGLLLGPATGFLFFSGGIVLPWQVPAWALRVPVDRGGDALVPHLMLDRGE